MPLTNTDGSVNPGEASLAFGMTIASSILGGLIAGVVMGYAFSKGSELGGGIRVREYSRGSARGAGRRL